MDNKITIKCPDGYILNQEDYAKGIISFIKEKLPISWIDFCKRFPIKMSEKYISYNSEILNVDKPKRNDIKDKNIFINQEEAEKFLTLIQLRRIWWEYHKSEKDFPDNKEYWYIGYCKHYSTKNQFVLGVLYTLDSCGLFWFKSKEVGEKFLHYFEKELKQIKELL